MADSAIEIVATPAQRDSLVLLVERLDRGDVKRHKGWFCVSVVFLTSMLTLHFSLLSTLLSLPFPFLSFLFAFLSFPFLFGHDL